jgi:hypothetical protein
MIALTESVEEVRDLTDRVIVVSSLFQEAWNGKSIPSLFQARSRKIAETLQEAFQA